MGKSKKTGGSGGDKGGTAAEPQCTCDHPYICSCGNRPPRPSKGHKWDGKAWGGKGHKQKGASGQTAAVDQKAKTTEVGKTTIATWQKLPSQLLADFAKREKFRNPKYKALDNKTGKHQYRLILPDSKDPKKDLFFVPPTAVDNEEQAKEEAALLALLHITPKIPHERSLPEPYKTTWLTAINQLKVANKQSLSNNADTSSTNTLQPAKQNASIAQASDNLVNGRITSQAQQKQTELEKRKAFNQRIRRHDAIRMANALPRLFMSAVVRKAMDGLLRGDSNALMMIGDGEGEEGLEEAEDDMQREVERRLFSEGFTKLQARRSFQSTQKQTTGEMTAHKFERIYEECLQWLLLHIDEDDLPDGFDPSGSLEVVGEVNSSGSSSSIAAESRRLNAIVTNEGRAFAQNYGITPAEAALVFEQHQKTDSNTLSHEAVFWRMVLNRANHLDLEKLSGSMDTDECHRQLEEELEALKAIFEESCHVRTLVEGMQTQITIQMDSSMPAKLVVQVERGRYPSVPPNQVLLSCTSWPRANLGTALHCRIAEFLSDCSLDEPAIFEIHGFVASLLEDIDKVEITSLIKESTKANKTTTIENPTLPSPVTKTDSTPRKVLQARRPRETSPFWIIPPSKTPEATAFPKLSPSLEKARSALPAASARRQFLNLLKDTHTSGQVILLTGETGCGKSTQIPQFILEENPKTAKIVVCQPRRVAATGVATRVAEERGEAKPGIDSVGFVVRGESALSKKTRLVFCTTGVLLRQMQRESAFDALTHIVLDEVHERSLDMDILLALLKEKLPENPHLTVVLMSATLDADKFAGYWGLNTPKIHIPGRTFPVTDYFLDDVLEFTRYMPPKKKGKTPKDLKNMESDEEELDSREINGVRIDELVARIDEATIDFKLLVSLVKYIIASKEEDDDGSILIFLPGAPEINKALEIVRKELTSVPVLLLPLHGGLQPSEQRKVFKSAGSQQHKVIFSTNIAETSITIPDCTSVIDCAREKQSSYDPYNRMPLLIESFCSKASIQQRRGRAGRVRPGTCYKLISRGTFRKLRQDTEPEILRSALDQTLLSLLFLGIDCSVSSKFISSLLDAPNKESLKSAFESLTSLGAVDKLTKQLTPLGMQLAGIPAPPIVGKIAILGSILGCRDAGLAMAAGMSLARSPLLRVDAPFNSSGGDEEDPIGAMKRKTTLDERKRVFEQVGKSDHAFIAKIFLDWDSLDGPERKRYCDKLGLSIPGMREMQQLNQQLDSAVSSLGYKQTREANKLGNSWRIIRAVAVAGMSPSQLVKIVRPAASYEETAEGSREKEGRAQELKFFLRTSRELSMEKYGNEERVFIHPSSGNFSVGNYSCPWLVFNNLVRTSKPFLRDVTECDPYSLLLFGGEMEILASKSVILIDGWCEFSASPKIGTLVGGIRRKLDDLLMQKVSDPTFEIAATPEMKIICRLIRNDGL